MALDVIKHVFDFLSFIVDDGFRVISFICTFVGLLVSITLVIARKIQPRHDRVLLWPYGFLIGFILVLGYSLFQTMRNPEKYAPKHWQAIFQYGEGSDVGHLYIIFFFSCVCLGVCALAQAVLNGRKHIWVYSGLEGLLFGCLFVILAITSDPEKYTPKQWSDIFEYGSGHFYIVLFFFIVGLMIGACMRGLVKKRMRHRSNDNMNNDK
jgi:FtsH-binding integral membrane protein